MQHSAAQQAQQTRKRSVLVAALGGAIVAAAITAVLLAGNPTPSTTPAQTAASEVKACQSQALIEQASVEHGGSGMIRFRRGDFVSQLMVLNGSPQAIVFPGVRPEGFPLKETIIIEGNATNVMLGAEGDHFIMPRLDGSYSYDIIWQPKRC